MGARPKYDKETVLAAIKGSGGIVSTIAYRMKCSWKCADNYTKKWDASRTAIAEEQETILDMAEGTIIKGIKENDIQAAKWLLSTKGRHRGYGESMEVKNTGAIEVSLIKRVIIDPRA